MVAEHSLQQLRNFLQQLLQIQNGRQLTSDLIQRLQHLALGNQILVKIRIVDGDRQLCRQEHQHFLMRRLKIVRLRTLDVQHADDTIA